MPSTSPDCASHSATSRFSTASTSQYLPAASSPCSGPNGAGKTTTVQHPVHPHPRRRRQVRVAGHSVVDDPNAVRAAIGVTGQFSAVDNLLTADENLS